MSRTRNFASLLIIPLAFTSASIRADVVIAETLDIDGAAGFSILGMQGNTTTNLTPEKSRIDSDVRFKSRLINTFAGKAGNTSQIIRLDQGRVYDVLHADKQYTEMTFEQMRAAMQQATQQMEQAANAQAASQPQQLPVSAEECQWSEPVVEAKQTGERATVAGFDTARAIVTLKQTCTDAKTGKACEMVWSIDQWLASSAPGGEESKAFAINYAKQLGLDAASMKAVQARMQQAFSQYKGSWTEVMAKAGDFHGYPLKTTVQMSMGGPQCTTASGTQVAADPMFADAVDAGIQAGASSAVGQAAAAAGQGAAQQVGGDVAGGVAGSAAGAFASKLGSSLLSKMRKKKEEAAAQPAADAQAADTSLAPSAGMIRLFRVKTETTALRSGPVPASTFDVPPGYTKVVPKTAEKN